MARHSSESRWPFYWSVVGWILPWVLVAAVAGVAVWIAVDALGHDVSPTSPPGARPKAVATPSPSPSPSTSPRTTPSPKASHEKQARPRATPTRALITEGITVQVLNGTNSSTADDLMADRLASLGYDVIAVAPALSYDETTVYYSNTAAAPAAKALAARFGWRVGPKPDNLSSAVDLHVVVGADQA